MGEAERSLDGQMSHLFSCLLMLISCHACSCHISQSLSPQIGMLLPSATQTGTDACIRFHFASSLSFVSHSYGFLSRGFLPCGSLRASPCSSNHSHLSHHLVVFIPPTSFIPQTQLASVHLTSSFLHPFKLPSSLLSPRVIFPCICSTPVSPAVLSDTP